MGWKTLKERFEIKHDVQVTEKGICIGSPYVHDIVVVNPITGVAGPSKIFNNFMEESCPLLAAAYTWDVLDAIEAQDEFTASIPVYTYDGGDIIEKLCEAPGWPNVTHDGCMMYENMFSTDKAEVIAWAKSNADSAIRWRTGTVAQLEKELAEARADLDRSKANWAKLESDWPAG